MVEILLEELKEEREFFLSYEKKFADMFANYIENVESLSLPKSALRTIGVKVYKTLFSFKGDKREELYRFTLKVAENEIDIKPIFSKVFLSMAKDFTDHLLKNDKDIRKLKTFISLIDEYLSVIEQAYAKYVESLRDQVKTLKKEKINENEEIIFHLLKAAFKRKKPITVLEFYKEVPVTCRTSIKSIAENQIKLDFKNCSKKIFSENKDIFIKINESPKPISATILKIDYRNNEIVVSNFRFTEIPQERRRFVRVQPDKEIEITLENGKTAKGKIVDISLGGVGIVFKTDPGFEKGSSGKVRFEIDGTEIELTGEVKYTVPYDGGYRIGFEFLLTSRAEELLSEYIMRRQFEILKELRSI